MEMRERDIALAFNGRINARDPVGLAALMADNHAFIDKAGARMVGKDSCFAAWRRFFAMFPDYRNEISDVVEGSGCVILVGRSVCADPGLSGPALWTARIDGGAVSEWRVMDDSIVSRQAIGLAPRA